MNTIIDLTSVKRSCRSCHQAHLCLAKGLDIEELSRFDRTIRHGRIIQRGEYLYRQGDECRLHSPRALCRFTCVSFCRCSTWRGTWYT
jgi:CRP/FNR family transcriptional regulator